MSKAKPGETTPRGLAEVANTLSPTEKEIIRARISGLVEGYNTAWRQFKERFEIAAQLGHVIGLCDEIVLYSEGERRRQRLEELYDRYAALTARYFDYRRRHAAETEAGFSALNLDVSLYDPLPMLQARLAAWDEARHGNLTELRRMAAEGQGEKLTEMGRPPGSATWLVWLYHESRRIKRETGITWNRVASRILHDLSSSGIADEFQDMIREVLTAEGLSRTPGDYLRKMKKP